MPEDDLPIYDLPLLSGKAFRFFLPGVLRAAYADPYGEPEYWLYLHLSNETDHDPWFGERLDPLTPAQAALVLQVIERHDPEAMDDDSETHEKMVARWRRRAMPSESDSS